MNACVFQFSKAPLLNHVKTRMAPVLSPQACVELHCALTTHTCRELSSTKEAWDFQLWVDQQPQHEFFRGLTAEFPGIKGIFEQRGTELGERMHCAFSQVLGHYDAAIVVGSDCPSLSKSMIIEMFDILATGVDCVLIPALDGGYVAMGLKRHESSLFNGIEWGSDGVLEQTLRALHCLSWSFHCLPALADIDRPDDLRILPQGFY